MLSLFLLAMRPLAVLFPSFCIFWPLTLMSSRSCRRRLMRLSPIRWVIIPRDGEGEALAWLSSLYFLRGFCPKHKHQIIYLLSQVMQWKKNPILPMQEMWVWYMGWEDPLESEMATQSSILAMEIPWTEEPGGLQFMGLQRVREDWDWTQHI